VRHQNPPLVLRWSPVGPADDFNPKTRVVRGAVPPACPISGFGFNRPMVANPPETPYKAL